jgi:Type II CAAX prenyl endopeptidase Rce1-like
VTLRHSLVGWLPSPLLESRRAWLAIATGWVCAFFPSLALSWLASALLPNAAGPEFNVGGAMAVFLLVVFAPVTETLIMAGVLVLLLRFVRPPVAILVSAAAWGFAHSYAAPAWGLVIWWPFLIFSTLFVVWRERGFFAGVGVAASTHALQNLAPALLLATSN